MKSKINEMYAQGLLTAGGIANAIASGWITDADAVSILGEEDGLAAAKTARIAQSKAALAAYLEAHPIQWTDGAYYAITADKQQQLASKIMAATMAQTLSADYRLTWNSTGEAPNCCSRSSPNETRRTPSRSPPTSPSPPGPTPSPTPACAQQSSTASPTTPPSSKPAQTPTASPTPEPGHL